MAALQAKLHEQCILCGARHPQGLRLNFGVYPDGHVEAQCLCDAQYQGYTGHLHGGVISAILDSAMTNCLFAHGRVGMTGELKVRFLKPVDVGVPALVRARLDASHGPLHCMSGELLQEGETRARATAKFMEVPDAYVANNEAPAAPAKPCD